MSQIKGSKVLITGGASGIGKLLGRRLLEQGAQSLTIWDINEQALQKTAEEFSDYNIHAYCINLRDTKAIQNTAKEVLSNAGNIDILINNAGVVVGKDFAEHNPQDIDFTLEINTAAVMHTTLAFLSSMLQQKSGHIVNISSAAGMLSNPKMSVYAGSKWAVLGWSESLRLELRNTGVEVSTITPSYIDTGMFEGVKTNPLLPLLKTEKVVQAIIKAITHNKRYVRLPFLVKILPFVKGILPPFIFDVFVGKWLGIYNSMAPFKGRK